MPVQQGPSPPNIIPPPPLPPLGEGRVHQCLRNKRKELSESCRKEELLLEEKEVSVKGGGGRCGGLPQGGAAAGGEGGA